MEQATQSFYAETSGNRELCLGPGRTFTFHVSITFHKAEFFDVASAKFFPLFEGDTVVVEHGLPPTSHARTLVAYDRSAVQPPTLEAWFR